MRYYSTPDFTAPKLDFSAHPNATQCSAIRRSAIRCFAKLFCTLLRNNVLRYTALRKTIQRCALRYREAGKSRALLSRAKVRGVESSWRAIFAGPPPAHARLRPIRPNPQRVAMAELYFFLRVAGFLTKRNAQKRATRLSVPPQRAPPFVSQPSISVPPA